jgi:hypothetical protein
MHRFKYYNLLSLHEKVCQSLTLLIYINGI